MTQKINQKLDEKYGIKYVYYNIEKAMNDIQSRPTLIEGNKYYMIKKNSPLEYVGTFEGSYRQGSGEGMTYIRKFYNDRGELISFHEDMWGPTNDRCIYVESNTVKDLYGFVSQDRKDEEMS